MNNNHANSHTCTHDQLSAGLLATEYTLCERENSDISKSMFLVQKHPISQCHVGPATVHYYIKCIVNKIPLESANLQRLAAHLHHCQPAVSMSKVNNSSLFTNGS